MKTPALIHVLFAALFALVAAGGYGLWYLAVAHARADASDAATRIAAIEDDDAAVAHAKDTIAALESDESALNAYFVSTEDIVSFLEGFGRIGRTLGSEVEVASVSPVDATTGRITLALHITGSFEAVLRTLGAIEYGPRDIRTVSVTLDTPPGDASAWTAAAVFSVGALVETP